MRFGQDGFDGDFYLSGMKASLLVLLFVGSCVTSQKNAQADLRNTRWMLRELNGASVAVPEGGREAFILFAAVDDKISGIGGCNNFFGTAAVNASTISFSGIGATRMACPDMAIESGFFQAMEGEVTFEISGDKMTWQRSGKIIARFEAGDEK